MADVVGKTAMPILAVIGYGAMARYVAAAMRGSDWDLDHCIVREGRETVWAKELSWYPKWVRCQRIRHWWSIAPGMAG